MPKTKKTQIQAHATHRLITLQMLYLRENIAVYLQERIEESGKGAEHKVYHRYKGDVHDLASLIICKAEWSHW